MSRLATKLLLLCSLLLMLLSAPVLADEDDHHDEHDHDEHGHGHGAGGFMFMDNSTLDEHELEEALIALLDDAEARAEAENATALLSEFDVNMDGVLNGSELLPAYSELLTVTSQLQCIEHLEVDVGGRKLMCRAMAHEEEGDDHEGHDHSEEGHDEHDHSEESHDEHDHSEESHDEHGHDEHGHDEHDHGEAELAVVKVKVANQTWECTDLMAHEDDHHDDELNVYRGGVTLGLTFASCVLSFFCCLLIPSKDTPRRRKVLNFLLAFASGALMGDTMLHLLPAMYGTESSVSNTWRGLVVLIGLFVFFVAEKMVRGRHFHESMEGAASDDGVELVDVVSKDEEAADPVKKNDSGKMSTDIVGKPMTEDECRAEAFMSLAGDALHNITDGLAIAATASVSTQAGVATFLAIVFHEIPQELGDFSILLKGGFTFKQALLANFGVSLTAMLGAIVGLLVASLPDASLIMLGLVAGSFIYISASDLVPILHKTNNKHANWTQSLGIVLGVVAMLIVTAIEVALGADHGHSH